MNVSLDARFASRKLLRRIVIGPFVSFSVYHSLQLDDGKQSCWTSKVLGLNCIDVSPNDKRSFSERSLRCNHDPRIACSAFVISSNRTIFIAYAELPLFQTFHISLGCVDSVAFYSKLSKLTNFRGKSRTYENSRS